MMPLNGLVRKQLLAGILLALPAASFAQVSFGISINIAPPALPVYVQPPCPMPNYIWTPGYWAWDPNYNDYFWVPGTWVAAPQPGYLWTPGYWGWGTGGVYLFHAGYWGTQVGFYGGVNYGFGYGGVGFVGGEWRNGTFAYNTAVVNVNTTVVHNTYINKTVINNTTIINNNRTSFNGGPNGIAARPTPQEQAFSRQPHIQPTSVQVQHQQVARQDRSNFVSVNKGLPAHAAVPRPVANVTELQHAAVPAKGAPAMPRVASAAPSAPPSKPPIATQPASRPSSATRPPVAQPQVESRPATRPPSASHPAPAAQPAPHAATEAKPAAHPAPHPATVAKPAPHPAPAEHPKEPEKHPQS
jgi:hypothetical protein